MEFSIVRSTQISKVYQNQNRIAELNQKYPFKSAQGQVDRVTISSTAERLLQENQDAQTAPVSPKPTQGSGEPSTLKEQDTPKALDIAAESLKNEV